MNGLAGGLHESSVPALTRIRHRFFTVAPEPSALTALPLARAPRRAVQYACGALGRAPGQERHFRRLATKTYA